jgi:hypothetical protein
VAITPAEVKAALKAAIAGITPARYPTIPFVAIVGQNVRLEDQPTTVQRHFEVVMASGEMADVHNTDEDETLEVFEVHVQYVMGSDVDADDDLIRSDLADIKRTINDGSWRPAWTTHSIVLKWPAPVPNKAAQTWMQAIPAEIKFLEAAGGVPVPIPDAGGPAQFALGPAAGTGAVINASSLYDGAGWVDFTVGTSPPGSGVLGTLTGSRVLNVLSTTFAPGNQAAADIDLGVQMYAVAGQSQQQDFNFENSGGQPLAVGSRYVFHYSRRF